MTTAYTANTKLQKPAFSDKNWDVAFRANADTMDAVNAIGDLAVTVHETPSASLNVDISGGLVLKADGTVGTYAGVSSHAVTLSATTYFWLDGSLALQSSTSAFPTTASIRLAIVTAGSSTITSIADARVPFAVCYAACLPLAGGTLTDGANVIVGSTTGTKIGTSVSQKLSLWNATPVVQPSDAAQAALTSGAGTAGTSVADVGASFSQTTLNDNFASLVNLTNALRSALVATGVIKGSA